jgi:hypothetical protein
LCVVSGRSGFHETRPLALCCRCGSSCAPRPAHAPRGLPARCGFTSCIAPRTHPALPFCFGAGIAHNTMGLPRPATPAAVAPAARWPSEAVALNAVWLQWTTSHQLLCRSCSAHRAPTSANVVRKVRPCSFRQHDAAALRAPDPPRRRAVSAEQAHPAVARPRRSAHRQTRAARRDPPGTTSGASSDVSSSADDSHSLIPARRAATDPGAAPEACGPAAPGGAPPASLVARASRSSAAAHVLSASAPACHGMAIRSIRWNAGHYHRTSVWASINSSLQDMRCHDTCNTCTAGFTAC